MADISTTAAAFFAACETGKGWAACAPFCHPDAAFAAQAEPLTEITTLAGYCDWMQGLIGIMPDGRYTLKSWATDAERGQVVAFATFHGTHTGTGGPPPTGKATSTDYVYVIAFDGDRIRHMTKIWNAGWALRELGWA